MRAAVLCLGNGHRRPFVTTIVPALDWCVSSIKTVGRGSFHIVDLDLAVDAFRRQGSFDGLAVIEIQAL
jgi:hypothetical protein